MAVSEYSDRSTDSIEKIAKHRADLEALAESDLPANWLAQAFLEIADETGAKA